MSQFIVYLGLALVILLTAGVARSRGRNPWLWTMASTLLMFLPGTWQALSALPLAALLLTPKLQPDPNNHSSNLKCPRCEAPNSSNYRYCISCGWELGKAYSPDVATRDATVQRPAGSFSGDRQSNNVSDRAGNNEVRQAPQAPEALKESSTNREHMAAQAATPENTAILEDPAVAKELAVSKKIVSRGPLTAASLTERGQTLLADGRPREAIDQFSKAIILDPNYKPAWERRAEAYQKLGLAQEAAKDTLHLDTIKEGT